MLQIEPLPVTAPIRIAASCVGVVKIYWTATGEVHALKGVDAIFPAGEVTAVVGPSGSGKSSLLRILAGLDQATAGSVTVGDTELSGLSAGRLRKVRRRLVSYIFQRPSHNLIPYFTVAEHLEQAARLRAVKGFDEDGLLATLGLEHRRGHRPGQLSGGEQQRVAFAQAVIGRPALILADEPTAELDSRSGEALLATVHELAASGVAVVVSTHDPGVVRTADRIYYLRHGALEAETSEARQLSVIDAAGRIQLPPQMLELFPGRRALLEMDGDEVRILPP